VERLNRYRGKVLEMPLPMVLEFHPEVQKEIQSAFDWYEDKSVGLGERFLNELDAGFISIQTQPKIHQAQIGNIRRCLVQKFPFGILFIEKSSCVYVLALMHLKQRPYYWLSRK